MPEMHPAIDFNELRTAITEMEMEEGLSANRLKSLLHQLGSPVLIPATFKVY